MSITKDTVKKISKLSRIASNEKFEDNMIKDLNAILKFVEQLNEVTIDNVEPLNSTVDQELIKRDDTVSLMNEKKDILSNSPEDNDDFYIISELLDNEGCLNDYLNRNHLGFYDRLLIFKSILLSVQQLHSLNIVHADLKTENMVLPKNARNYVHCSLLNIMK